MKFAFYCRCGDTMVGEIEPAVLDLQEIFLAIHHGDGHGLVTRREAANARRRKDRREARS